MLQAYLASEAKFPRPFPPGNHRVNLLATICRLPARQLRRCLCWLPVLALLPVLHSSAQTAQLVLPTEAEGVSQPVSSSLPDSPGAVRSSASTAPFAMPDADDQNPGPFDTSQLSRKGKNGQAKPCARRAHRSDYPRFSRDPCDPYRPFVEVNGPPLSVSEKGYLALHDVTDPFNLLTIAGTSAFTIGINSHTAYGPGMRGFGYNAGTSLGQDVTGEFLGTFALPVLFHQDPRYFRMPEARPFRRFVHAVSRVVIAQGDNGKPMPNYANLINGAASAEIANLYVPGLATDGASTTKRIFTGYLTEPIGPLVAEFLPDIASHIHVHVVVLQRYLNQISAQH